MNNFLKPNKTKQSKQNPTKQKKPKRQNLVAFAVGVELQIKEKSFISIGLFALVIDVSSSCVLKLSLTK